MIYYWLKIFIKIKLKEKSDAFNANPDYLLSKELGITQSRVRKLCPIEGFNRSKVEKFLADNAVIDLDEFGVSYMAGFGYRAQDIPVKKRQKLAEVYSEVE